MVIKQKIIGLTVSGILVAVALTLNRIYRDYHSLDTISKSSNMSVDLRHFPKGLKREYLFDNGVLFTDQLNGFLSYDRVKSNYEFKLDEDKVYSVLLPWLLQKLQVLFDKSGRSFKDLRGRIYYELKFESVEILILWKSYPSDKGYSFYDRFEVSFDSKNLLG